MLHGRLLFIQTFVLISVGALHVTALNHALYWHFPWLDTGVHFLGGLGVMLFAYYAFSRMHMSTSPTLLFVFLACIAFGWELFELWSGIPREANFAFDTTLDLAMDALGGVVGYLLAKRVSGHDRMSSHDADQEHSSTSSVGSS